MAKKTATKRDVSVQNLGTNVEAFVTDGKLHLVIDLSEAGSPSRSGKTIIVGSTEGNKRVGDTFVGLNVYRYPQKKK